MFYFLIITAEYFLLRCVPFLLNYILFSHKPRRISAVSVAERVAYERGEEVGKSCGYSVRFESFLPRPHASVLFCTVGTYTTSPCSVSRSLHHLS